MTDKKKMEEIQIEHDVLVRLRVWAEHHVVGNASDTIGVLLDLVGDA